VFDAAARMRIERSFQPATRKRIIEQAPDGWWERLEIACLHFVLGCEIAYAPAISRKSIKRLEGHFDALANRLRRGKGAPRKPHWGPEFVWKMMQLYRDRFHSKPGQNGRPSFTRWAVACIVETRELHPDVKLPLTEGWVGEQIGRYGTPKVLRDKS